MAGILSYLSKKDSVCHPRLSRRFCNHVSNDQRGHGPNRHCEIGIKNPTPQMLAQLRIYFHLDQPVYIRYFYWLFDFVQGNWGRSLYTGTVSARVVPWIWTTLELQIPALLLSLGIGIPVGVYSAKRQYSKQDVAVTTTAIFGVSMPTFWLGVRADHPVRRHPALAPGIRGDID